MRSDLDANQHLPRAEVRMENGRSVLVMDGRPIPPMVYTAAFRSPVDSLSYRGKLWFNESDTRTFRATYVSRGPY